jgi:hypothetical protein
MSAPIFECVAKNSQSCHESAYWLARSSFSVTFDEPGQEWHAKMRRSVMIFAIWYPLPVISWFEIVKELGNDFKTPLGGGFTSQLSRHRRIHQIEIVVCSSGMVLFIALLVSSWRAKNTVPGIDANVDAAGVLDEFLLIARSIST